MNFFDFVCFAETLCSLVLFAFFSMVINVRISFTYVLIFVLSRTKRKKLAHRNRRRMDTNQPNNKKCIPTSKNWDCNISCNPPKNGAFQYHFYTTSTLVYVAKWHRLKMEPFRGFCLDWGLQHEFDFFSFWLRSYKFTTFNYIQYIIMNAEFWRL